MFDIRPATIADIPTIQLLVEQIWIPTYRPLQSQEKIDYMVKLMYNSTELSRQLTDKDYTFLLLYDGERPIGYTAFSKVDDAGFFKLHKIYVHPEYQGTGTGKMLLQHVTDAVKAAGGKTLELTVFRQNKARFFYEKMGFTIYEEKDFDIGGGFFMNDYVMRKEL